MKPSAWSQLDLYPHLRQLVAQQIDMQFADLHAMMRLPMDEVMPNVGCNLATAVHAFNLVTGASVLFYNSSPQSLRGDPRKNGSRFKQVLTKYYPWSKADCEQEGFTEKGTAKALWEWARNPLVHSLGVGKNHHALPGATKAKDQPLLVRFSKGPLSADQVQYLATTRDVDNHPDLAWTVVLNQDVLDLNVITFCWGIHELLRRLFEDEDQAAKAEKTAKHLMIP
jgi:hypothetical protein